MRRTVVVPLALVAAVGLSLAGYALAQPYPNNCGLNMLCRIRTLIVSGTSTFTGTGDFAGTLKADSLQTHGGGGTAALLYTTGTGQFTLGNTSNGVLGCFGNVCQITNAAFATSSTLQMASASTNGVTVTGATASNPVTVAATGTNSGFNFTTTGSGVWQLNSVNLPQGPVDYPVTVPDPVTVTTDTSDFWAWTNVRAATIQNCNCRVPTLGGGTGGPEVWKLTDTANGAGTAYVTVTIPCNAAVGANCTSCVINTAALPAATTLHAAVTTACTTADVASNIVLDVSQP